MCFKLFSKYIYQIFFSNNEKKNKMDIISLEMSAQIALFLSS